MRWFVLLALFLIITLLLIEKSESWGRRRSGSSSSSRRRSISFSRRRSITFSRRRTNSISRRRIVVGIRRRIVAPIHRRIVVPIRRRIVVPIRRRIVVPIRRRIVVPIRRRIVVPIRRRIVVPIRRRIVVPIRRRIVVPTRRRIVVPIRRRPTKGPSSGTSAGSPLKVSRGQVTFNVEGNDNKNSRYFSRKPHVPGGWSGVTLGRGYDMSQRNPDEIKKDLVAAGVDANTADKFKNAVGLKGQKARDWLKKNNLQDFTLTRHQQKKLFEKDYPRYVSRAKRIVEKYSKTSVKFDSLDPVSRDIATDIMYRGDYSMSSKNPAKKKRSERIQKVLESKSLQKLKDLMSDKKFWDAAGVDANRFNERKKAVEAACKKDPNCK